MMKRSIIKRFVFILLMEIIVCSAITGCEKEEIDYSVLSTLLAELPMDCYIEEKEMIYWLESNNWKVAKNDSDEMGYHLEAENGCWSFYGYFSDYDWIGPVVGGQFEISVNADFREREKVLTECYKIVEENYVLVKEFSVTDGRFYANEDSTLETIIHDEGLNFSISLCVIENN